MDTLIKKRKTRLIVKNSYENILFIHMRYSLALPGKSYRFCHRQE